MSAVSRPLLAVAAALLLCLALGSSPALSSLDADDHLRALFKRLDQNSDGELSLSELEAEYSAGALGDVQTDQTEGWTAGEAARTGRGALDGPDEGEGVTEAELNQHLRLLMQDHQVVEWVVHGLNQPQYAPAFKRNAITALDFPFLVADGGAALEADLGIASRLHQQQILRGLKRLILGLGKLPPPPQLLACSVLNKTAVRLTWQPPGGPGHPAFHKYVLERQRVLPGATWAASGLRGGAGGASSRGAAPAGGGLPAGIDLSDVCAAGGSRWELVGEPDDEDFAWVDPPPTKEEYRYRLAAWSAFGRSPFVFTTATCAVRAVQKYRPAPQSPALPFSGQAAEQQQAPPTAGGNDSSQRQAAGAAAGAAVEGSSHAPGSGWSWSAASSAVVVALSILLKASQLRLGALAAKMLRSTWEAARRQGWPTRGRGGRPASPVKSGAANGSLRRVGSSRASLASLGSEPGAADEQLPLQEQPGVLLSHSSSLQQLCLGSREASRLHAGSPCRGSMQLEGSGLDPAAAAEALAGEDAELEVEQLKQAILRGTHCAHPGCHRRFDRLRDVRRRLESHYCSLCQRMFCLAHTRVSPHGPRGGCGLESKCVCHDCFELKLDPRGQAAYDRINRLPSRPGSSNGNVSGNGNGSGSGSAAAGAPGSPGEQEEADAGAGAPDGLSPAASHISAADSGIHLLSKLSPRRSSGQGQAPGDGARRRWRKAGKALLALARLKAASSVPPSPVQR